MPTATTIRRCQVCDRAIRPVRTTISQHPGTIVGTKGLCRKHYDEARHEELRGTQVDYLPAVDRGTNPLHPHPSPQAPVARNRPTTFICSRCGYQVHTYGDVLPSKRQIELARRHQRTCQA